MQVTLFSPMNCRIGFIMWCTINKAHDHKGTRLRERRHTDAAAQPIALISFIYSRPITNVITVLQKITNSINQDPIIQYLFNKQNKHIVLYS